MKHNWEYYPLDSICETFIDGDWIESKDQSKSGFRLIQTGNIGNGRYLDKTERGKFITEETFDRLKCTEIFKGDLLISRLPDPIGRACILPNLPERSITAVDCTIVRLKSLLLPKVLLHFTKSQNYSTQLERVTKGTTRKRVSRGNLGKIQIPVPPKEVQKQIVAELDKLNELITTRKEQLKELDNLAQSLFYDTFGDPFTNDKGWPIVTLGSISEKISNGCGAKIEADTYKSKGIAFFRCQNVWKNHFDYSDMVYVDENFNTRYQSSSLKHNDLIVTKIGRLYTENSSLGRVSLFQGTDYSANLSGNLSFIRLLPGVAPKFVLYVMISDYFKNYVRNTTSGGIDKRALNNSQLKAFSLYLPPLSLQEQFADQVEAIEKQKQILEASIGQLQTLLDSRMDYWFN